MELYGRNQGSEVDPSAQWGDTGLEESMWRMDVSGRETYPERLGVSDCVYYMRTGFCGFGTRCRYNHPRDRVAAVAAARLVGGEYPERPGEPVCQYYLKTGTCKFGTTCKFHHPRNAGGSLANAPLNIHGYPLRTGEKECSYYLKTGQCKFGLTCKFHHPQPAGMSMPAAAPPFYPTVQSSVPVPEQAAGSSPSFRVARPPLVPGSYVPGSYGPVLLSPGVMPMAGWGSYSGPVSPALSPGVQPAAAGGSVYGVTPLSPSTPGLAGSYPLLSSAGQSITGVTEHKFPERPGEPECQYYLKTGNCKYGSSCKYHHPPDQGTSAACFLGPLGLPLRPGAQPCTFYMQNGYCKFGPTCKFDHPVSLMKYSPSASSLPETPAGYLTGSLPHSSSTELLPEYALGSNIQRPSQSSALLSSTRSTGADDESHHSN
ncbi:zinc finger CCCH domain-containing protein 32 [Amaranthus tricolor]|uniref:zinc finger CCCH domain-containing protein 32 n=1 Tax=Amaranthus tricolor TaxID=29722 RepID=UPI002590D1A3|nr:zinc finger CCCH domain-containing protein 32 [Amaranthus tricolor]